MNWFMRDMAANVLGSTVLYAMDQSRDDFEPTEDGLEKLLKFLEVKDWPTFAQEATCFIVERENDVVRIIPTERERGGTYTHRNDLAVTCEPTAEGVLSTLLSLLES